ncbi:MAG: hypothetical protein LQ337_004094 [Flavoplaca oasis]|nr:MAG: hypothetical protein LQ337_004094 [Flavoplaca oasis]
MPSFEYTPLDDDRHCVRLLILKSGSSPVAIDCHLIQVPLGDGPSYEALSYTWGTPEFTSSISLNGTDFQVTPNLGSALKRLRLDNEDRIMWIDAICIDQANISEKSQQVQQMRRIYQSASRVVVWLGSEAEESNIAMAAIERMGSSFDSATMRLEDACNVPDVDISDTAWQALGRLFRRSWYKRIWILQEVSASKNVIVVCGPQSVPWTTFCFAAFYIHYRAGREPGPSPLKDIGYEALFTLCTFMFNRTVSEDSRRRETGLLRLLTQFRHCEATNPKDKVYALLGMASDMPDDADFKPNYAKPVAEVYQDLVEFIVTKDRNLDVLRACEISGPEHDLPSWVPDWSRASSYQALYSFASTHPIKASGNSVAVIRILEDSSTLVAQGVYVDIVIEISDSPMSTSDAAPRDSLVERITDDIEPLTDGIKRLTVGIERLTDNIERLTDNIINNALNAIDTHGPAIRAAMGISSDGPPVPVSSARYRSDFLSNPRPISSFWTDTQLLGTTQASPMYGDIVCVLLGCSVPLILRPQEDDVYLLVGEASIAALMIGGVMKDVEEGRNTVREFHIV